MLIGGDPAEAASGRKMADADWLGSAVYHPNPKR